MTKKHFDAAAAIVNDIRKGKWTNKPRYARCWTPPSYDASLCASSFERAVWTAEAFIMLAECFNPCFNRDRFLKACELVS